MDKMLEEERVSKKKSFLINDILVGSFEEKKNNAKSHVSVQNIAKDIPIGSENNNVSWINHIVPKLPGNDASHLENGIPVVLNLEVRTSVKVESFAQIGNNQKPMKLSNNDFFIYRYNKMQLISELPVYGLRYSDRRRNREMPTEKDVTCIPKMHGSLQNTTDDYRIYNISGLEDSQNLRKKKTRTVFSRNQIYQLESTFDMKRYLSSSDRTTLANALKLTETQIKIWFQNRRNKWKRQISVDMNSQPFSPIDHCSQNCMPIFCSPFKYHRGLHNIVPLPQQSYLHPYVGQTSFPNISSSIQKPVPTPIYSPK